MASPLHPTHSSLWASVITYTKRRTLQIQFFDEEEEEEDEIGRNTAHSTFITTVTRCQLLCSGGALEGLEGLAAAARQAKADF